MAPGPDEPAQRANHWVSADGGHLVHDDARARLPGRLRSGESDELPLVVTAPARPGRYELQLDVVQENVNWFADRGSAIASVNIEIEPNLRRDVPEEATEPSEVVAAEASDERPMFMIRGIERREIESLVSSCGGEILKTDEHITEWYSYRYITRRVGPGPVTPELG